MREEWKDIEGYEGMYQVSNMGRVKSLKRTVWDSRGFYKTVPERILKPRKNRFGYLQLYLCKEGSKKSYTVHRLVAIAFIPNPQGLPEVNHLSEDKADSRVSNLEWCSSKYNANYGTRNKRMAEKKGIPIYGINKVSGLIVEFPSAREAGRQLGIHQGSITRCCKGKQKSAGNYYWMYAEEES